MMVMFEGEKTYVFWIGLIILGLASVTLFSVVWYFGVLSPSYPSGDYYWRILTPPIVGAIIFILIGLYMMKSGGKRQRQAPPPPIQPL